MNENEQCCFDTYAFMKKIISNKVDGFNIIDMVCKDNSINS